ncbi:MAG: MmcQ/YjbR family DNA-binding protein [Candidatus Saccharimonadales bacterium]|nr:MmcQ/YjbR family DNA-binding protein [Candidatus Saccharimonadales bacterium]
MKTLLTHKILENYLLAKPGTRLDYPFGEEVAVYKVGGDEKEKMFAIIAEGKQPVQISLKCDPLLAETLRQKYESVMPGYHLNKRHWNTVVCSGQLTQQEVFDLVDHSYNLIVESLPKEVQSKLQGREE